MEEMITITDLSFNYPDGRQALCGINLTIARGESVALMGPNGAGKSTLALHMNGILRSDGHVKLMGKAIGDDNLKWVRSRVGLVFQDPDDQLFSPTVFDDVAFGPINMGMSDAGIRRAVTNTLNMVGLAGYEKRSPHHLSIGEKKRAAIATVLSMSPEMLVIDEPSSNLDPRGKWELTAVLKALPVTKVVVSHDLELVAALCERVVILDRGRIAADGPAADILADKELLHGHSLAAAY